MAMIDVRVPQLGEGLHEAILVKWLKHPGDWVRRDEPLYQMETDKAVTDMESPCDGLVVQTTVDEGRVVQIGEVVARLNTSATAASLSGVNTGAPPLAATADQESGGGISSTTVASLPGNRNRDLSPRTRAYLKSLGLLDSADRIPRQGPRLTSEDIDLYLRRTQEVRDESSPLFWPPPDAPPRPAPSPASSPRATATQAFTETELPQSQQLLNHRLARAALVAVPATVVTDVDWSALESAAHLWKQPASGRPASTFLLFLWKVAQAMGECPPFRSSLAVNGRTLRTYAHANLGIAVALPDHQLLTAVVRAANTLSLGDFIREAQARINAARAGQDQADESVTLNVSNIGSLGMRSGVPVLVPPAIGTLALGRAEWQAAPGPAGYTFEKRAAVTLVFDHRIANGSTAADFLNRLKSRIQQGA